MKKKNIFEKIINEWIIFTLCHKSGTLLSKTLKNTYSKSKDITNNPSIAFPKLIKLEETAFSNLLNLINSCCSTVFMDSSY